MKTKLIRFLLEMAAIFGCIFAVRWPLDHAYDPFTEILAILVSGTALALGFTLWKRAQHYGTTHNILFTFQFPEGSFENDPRLRTALRLMSEAAAQPLPKED